MARQVADAQRAEEEARQAQDEAAHYSSQVQSLQASCSEYAQSAAAQTERLSQVSVVKHNRSLACC